MKNVLFFFWLVISTALHAQESPVVFVIHGGAGNINRTSVSSEKEKEYTEKLDEAVSKGYEILKKGGTALDAIEAAIIILEDSPLFNAGKGSVFTAAGTNEMDAAIMEGKTLKAGSVAGVRSIKNPITAARKVMENSPHVMMSGQGAEEFAREQKLVIVDTAYFFHEPRYKQLQKIKDEERKSLEGRGDLLMTDSDYKFGTVGAVALDRFGNIAAGTSTGGMTNKKYGRIGDAPIIGAGTYANNKTCAVSATGHGEYFIRAVVGHDISALMEYKNLSLKDASNEVINKKLVEMGGEGGIIALDAKGNYSFAFNSTGMFRAVIDKEGKKQIGIFK
jgi:L-asparaginase / beta-aspartyl-peptidase